MANRHLPIFGTRTITQCAEQPALPPVKLPVLLLVCHPRAAANSPPYRPADPWHAIVAEQLTRMTDLEIVSLLREWPEYAGYIVAVYGTFRWPENALDLETDVEAEQWHRDRHRLDQQVKLKANLQLLYAWLTNVPARRRIRQQILRLEYELNLFRLRGIRQTLRSVQDNQAAYDPWATVPPATPLLAQYQTWRGAIVQRLTLMRQHWTRVVMRSILNLAGHAAPLTAPLPPVALPALIPAVVNTRHCNDYPRFIELLIKRDCLEALIMLRRLGIFNPVSYHRRGWTLLHDALLWEAPKVSKWLLNRSVPSDLWTLPYGTTALQHNMRPWTDLEFLAHKGWMRRFKQAWALIEPDAVAINALAHDVFNPDTLRHLCTVVDTPIAERLAEAPFYCNIAKLRLPVLHNWILHPWVVDGGTTWHLAVQNPNIRFLDFVGRHNGGEIDDIDITGRRPMEKLLTAAAPDRLRIRRLVQWGADTREAAVPVIRRLPLLTDTDWILYFHAQGTNLAAGQGTVRGSWLHEVVRGLHAELARVNGLGLTAAAARRQRAQCGERALALIQAIKRGNGFSAGRIADTDTSDRTASRLLRDLGMWRFRRILLEL
ncbi:hypothetical protein BJX64DRAFT_268702 [Aspergillus heterothallicus]